MNKSKRFHGFRGLLYSTQIISTIMSTVCEIFCMTFWSLAASVLDRFNYLEMCGNTNSSTTHFVRRKEVIYWMSGTAREWECELFIFLWTFPLNLTAVYECTRRLIITLHIQALTRLKNHNRQQLIGLMEGWITFATSSGKTWSNSDRITQGDRETSMHIEKITKQSQKHRWHCTHLQFFTIAMTFFPILLTIFLNS